MVKRLEEVSVSCRGAERVQLLTRWLVALKEIERIFRNHFDNNFDHYIPSDDPNSPRKPTRSVLYWDPELGGEPVNSFVGLRFLKSQMNKKFLCFWRYTEFLISFESSSK
jgi:hypothetical protein